MEKTMYRLTKEQLAISIKRALPELTDKQLADQIEYVQKLRKQDPMIVDQELGENGELQIMRYGANLELALYIGQLTGSYLYTNVMEQWREILSSAQSAGSEGEVWSPLTKSFQELEFNFLNNIDPEFAFKLKEEGRLETFRGFLRKMWDKIEGNPSYEEANKYSREFSEELHEEYAKAKEEWSHIDKELVKWTLSSAGLGAILKGGMAWQIPAAGFCISAVGKLLAARTDRKNFKQTVPMAVLLDLEKKNKFFK